MQFIQNIYEVGDFLHDVLPSSQDNLREMLMIGARHALDNRLDCHGFSGRVYGMHRQRLIDYLYEPDISLIQSPTPGDIHSIWVNGEPYHTGIHLGDANNTTISKHGKKPEILVGTPEEVLNYYKDFAFRDDALAKVSQKTLQLPKKLWFQDFSNT